MSRNEIRLRRQRLTATGANKFRNYGDVLQRHEKEMRIKKIVRVFTMFAIVLILVMLIIILTRTEKRSEKKQQGTAWIIDRDQGIPISPMIPLQKSSLLFHESSLKHHS